MKTWRAVMVGLILVFSPKAWAGQAKWQSKDLIKAMGNSIIAIENQEVGVSYTDKAKALMDQLFANLPLGHGDQFCSEVEGLANVLVDFLQTYQGTMPDLKKGCLTRHDEYSISLRLYMTTTPNTQLLEYFGHSVNVDIWQPQLLSPFQAELNIKGVSIERDLEMRLSVKEEEEKVIFKISGFGINGFGFPLWGDISLPDSLMHFGVRGLELHNSGAFVIKLSAPLFNIPLSYKLNLKHFAKGANRLMSLANIQ